MRRLQLGDAVATVTKAVGIEPCEECKKRQAFLNSFGDRLAKLFSGEEVSDGDVETADPEPK